MKNYYYILAVLLFPLSLSAQNWELGFQGGATHYFGDLTNNEVQLNSEGYGGTGGIFLRRHFGAPIGLRANIFFASLKGNDAYYDGNTDRGFRFDGDNLEASLQAEWFLAGRERTIRPYVFGGVGWLYSTPGTSFFSTRPAFETSLVNNIQLDRREGPSGHTAVIPLGLGFDFVIGKERNAHLGFELSARPTLSDFVDGISNAGDADDNDSYATGSVTLSFPLGAKAPDADGDGISDEEDACPNTFGLEAYQGCPDTDMDGIVDRDDVCPRTAGLPNLNGCPDGDGDSIADKDDSCPTVAGVASTNGCPDGDGDGIADGEDACPTVAGLATFNGCPDSDNDGIADKDDDCPNQPGIAANNGCPVADSDNDGVPDESDACPTVAGTLNGCPDGDGDGVADKDDACPTVAGNLSGCPDTDKDGIADKDDNCPTVSGTANNKGCPEVNAKAKEVFSRALRGIQFETSSNRIKSTSYGILNEVVVIMRENPSYNLTIAGHTDSVGAADANQKLSERRAEAVKAYLVSKGIAGNRLTSVGYGENQPIADNASSAGRRQNRRVEFKVNF